MKSCTICGESKFTKFAAKTVSKNSEIVYGYKWTPEVRKSLEMRKCIKCKHVYAVDVPEELAEEYIEVADEVYLQTSDLRLATSEKVLDKLLNFKNSGKILDIGCGTGDFLVKSLPYYEVFGVELSLWAVEIARKNISDKSDRNFEIFDKDISIFKEFDFDVVTMWGVIEHLRDPESMIVEINKRLKPGGIVAIWTGDANSYPARIFRDKWWYVIGQHVNLFSKKSLNLIMERNDFEMVYHGIYPYSMRLGYLSLSLSRYPSLRAITKILNTNLLKNRMLTLKIPGEMFIIFKKKVE